jgi:26 proteasome complex subunit DSS1
MSNTQSQSQSQPQDQPSQQPQQQKPPVLEEDDEFEDFPIEGMPFQPQHGI